MVVMWALVKAKMVSRCRWNASRNARRDYLTSCLDNNEESKSRWKQWETVQESRRGCVVVVVDVRRLARETRNPAKSVD